VAATCSNLTWCSLGIQCPRTGWRGERENIGLVQGLRLRHKQITLQADLDVHMRRAWTETLIKCPCFYPNSTAYFFATCLHAVHTALSWMGSCGLVWRGLLTYGVFRHPGWSAFRLINPVSPMQ
jgi:hypothetical protein